MDLDLTSEQELLRDTVRGLCARHASLDVVRKLENDPVGYPHDFWTQLAELGLLGLTIADEWGGSGMTLVDAAVVYEELGRALVPSPHFVSAVVAAGVLAAAGSREQQQTWLPRIASGAAIFTVGWLEPDRGYGPRGVALQASRDGDGWRLSGVKRLVPFAQVAERIVVLARTDADVGFFLVDPQASGVTVTQQLTTASDTQFRVELDGVAVSAADVLSTGDGWSAWNTVMRDAIVLLAAQAVGGARQALDLAVEYAKTRHQFDKPLGAFQSIAHYLADAVTAVDGAQTLVWEAAWARDTGRPIERLAPMAKLFACDTYRNVTDTALHIFGGNGFTLEFDIQLYFRRAKALQLSWWDASYLEQLVAASVLDGQ